MFHFCQRCIPRHTCTQSNYIQYTLTKVQLLPPAVGWYASLTFIASLLRMLFWSLIHLNNVISHWQTKITKFAYIALHTEDTKQYKTRIVNGHGYMPLELSMYEVWACVCVCVCVWKCVSVCVSVHFSEEHDVLCTLPQPWPRAYCWDSLLMFMEFLWNHDPYTAFGYSKLPSAPILSTRMGCKCCSPAAVSHE